MSSTCILCTARSCLVVVTGEWDMDPIPGTKRVKYVEENAAAVDLKINKADLARAGTIINAETVSGDRYPPHHKVPVDEEKDGE